MEGKVGTGQKIKHNKNPTAKPGTFSSKRIFNRNDKSEHITPSDHVVRIIINWSGRRDSLGRCCRIADTHTGTETGHRPVSIAPRLPFFHLPPSAEGENSRPSRRPAALRPLAVYFNARGLAFSMRGNKKRSAFISENTSFGPSVEIRTRGLLNPIQARYQTSPHPDM